MNFRCSFEEETPRWHLPSLTKERGIKGQRVLEEEAMEQEKASYSNLHKMVQSLTSPVALEQ